MMDLLKGIISPITMVEWWIFFELVHFMGLYMGH